jgi:uncharacterized protein YjbI with pentapeptide repeats
VSIPVQAALTVIGRRKVENDQAGDNLAETTDSNKIKILDLSRTNLREANLNGANLNGAYLYRAHLNGAILNGAILNGAYLFGADLYGAYLFGANLFGANLNGADLNGAYLNRANLNRANLYGAELNRANLYGANLNGANLNEAKDLHPEQIKSACFWQEAIYTEAKWDEDKQLWVAEDREANQREIEKLKRDKNSDPRNPIDCNTK